MRRHALVLSAVAVLAACQGESANPAPSTTPEPERPGGVEPAATAGGGANEGPGASPASGTQPDGLQGASSSWREVATADDASRLSRLDQAWRMARAEAEAKGFASQVEALGALVDPNAALPGRLQPSPGDYRCRTFKIGSINGDGLGYVAYPWFRCSVELTVGGDLILSKATGSQRSQGLLYPDSERRLVFIGAQAWGSEERGYPRYGQMPERDQIGVLERIGDQRWRLVLPWPKQEAKLELLEISR